MALNGINYVTANEGGLVFYINTQSGELNRRADTIEDGVYYIRKYGLAESVYFSSDMDFATEEGFATDTGAKEMFNSIMEAV